MPPNTCSRHTQRDLPTKDDANRFEGKGSHLLVDGTSVVVRSVHACTTQKQWVGDSSLRTTAIDSHADKN
jgi:hypothetical protein